MREATDTDRDHVTLSDSGFALSVTPREPLGLGY